MAGARENERRRGCAHGVPVGSCAGAVAVVCVCARGVCACLRACTRAWRAPGSWFSGGGQLGHGSSGAVAAPALVESLAEEGVRVVSATAGELHTAVLTSDGEVGGPEQARTGQARAPLPAPPPPPTSAPPPPPPPPPTSLPTSPPPRAVGFACVVLVGSGQVMTCGAGEYGRLGLGSSSDVSIFEPVEYIGEPVTQVKKQPRKRACIGEEVE